MSREDIGWIFLGIAIALALKWLMSKAYGEKDELRK
jgi:hypothetical protein